MVEPGRRPDPLAGGVAGHVAAVREPVGHRQPAVGPVVVQGLGGQDHAERLVEQHVALCEEAIEHDARWDPNRALAGHRLGDRELG
jgi:hypothetical protein